MKKFDANRSVTKEDLDELESHIIIAVGKAIEEAKTELRSDIKDVEGKLGAKIDKLSYDVSDLRNRVIDLEIKHGTPHSHVPTS